jgi:hypothetical protein
MPKPTDAHRKLAALAGRWSGQETIPPGPWDPNGGVALGRCLNHVAVDGFILLHEYEQERNGAVNFRGHGVFAYDAEAKAYTMHWWDSLGVAPNVFRGDFQGNLLQMVCLDRQGHSRATWELKDATHYVFRMEISQDGQQWLRLMEGEYVREE